MSQIGVNGLTVLLNVTLVQEQGTGIMNTQTEALIVLMTFTKLILAEVSYNNKLAFIINVYHNLGIFTNFCVV